MATFVGVSPEMFKEFVFPYQEPIIGRFGLSYYGCCEPVHGRIKTIKQLPNLRKVSVSPWCDQEIMADELGQDYVFCRKPKPTLISTEEFDEDLIREDIRNTMRIAQSMLGETDSFCRKSLDEHVQILEGRLHLLLSDGGRLIFEPLE